MKKLQTEVPGQVFDDSVFVCCRFMENLQTEVLELEFNEFSRGMPTITEQEFASILLRYTTLSADDTDAYLSRLQQKLPDSKVSQQKLPDSKVS